MHWAPLAKSAPRASVIALVGAITLAACLSMIFSENRFPRRIMPWKNILMVVPPHCRHAWRRHPAATGAGAKLPNRPSDHRAVRAGGPTDILSRVIAQKMSEDWGQPVVVENRPGADTAIGAVQVAKAPPDGYTLLAAMDTTLVMNPATKTNLPYDPFKDFAAVTLAAKNTSLLTVRAEWAEDHR
jgi:hypothetical protein